MAVSVEGKIEEALEGRLQSLPAPANLPIAWTGRSFTKPSNGKYLELLFAPNVTNRVFIGSNDPHQRLGILQINLHWPHGDFERMPRDVAGQVAAHFPTDLVLVSGDVSVRVTEAPNVAPALTSATEITIPLTIPFEAWA